jgi:hypothetical protein
MDWSYMMKMKGSDFDGFALKLKHFLFERYSAGC